MEYGVFYCDECGREWPDELPPSWLLEVWPKCCGFHADLVKLLHETSQEVVAA